MNLAEAGGFVFDFDGTLAPNLDLPALRRRVMAQTRAWGVPAAVTEGRYILEIVTAAHAWLRAQEHPDADRYRDETDAFITNFELDAARRLVVFPEVRGLLHGLRRRDLPSAVVTRNCEQAVRATFPDIDQHVDVLLARDSVAHCKPDPRHLQQALENLGRPARRAVMIGDGRMDMQLGRSQGLFCVGVLTGSSDRASLLAAGADLVLDSIADLAPLL